MNPVIAIIQRNLLNYTRNRGRMIGSIVMSMFMLVMFSFMMKSSMSGFGEPMNYLIAGVIIMTVFQTGINHSSDILSDISDGYMKEVMVAPIARSQISIGNILSGAVVSTIQGTLTMIISLFIGFRINVLQVLLLIVVMLVSAMTFSAVGLFLATVSRNSPSFQTISSMIMMPGFLLPVVYLNPLTYVTSIFRYIALGAYKMSSAELVREGMAFDIYGFVITPFMGLMITVLIGTVFFALSVGKFNQADFSTVKVARTMRGGGAPG